MLFDCLKSAPFNLKPRNSYNHLFYILLMVIKKNTSAALLLAVTVYERTVVQMVVCKPLEWSSVSIPTEAGLEMLDAALGQGTKVSLIYNVPAV